ncbi:tRNA-dependent cyclodipeptide synthase [Nocardiopsis sp. HNM0947]|uniref:Cyclodipeptide synthase n=2 Tax=Nocardiopsis coralli TaxID=2772213 RepID=A0ABR9P7J8_9ACTN|nr:tRNA-dependent cyclodipeptide synthase [Nocardiopsis coralli]MBE2999811.1 tRNA-dependent cyclodipeptide synthase [Nocardiopsis coralli]
MEDGLEVRPFTRSCARVLARGEHALIGVSAGNGYFTQERLTQLLRWAGRRFAHIDVLHTDLHLDTMHRAGGADEEQAARRTKRSLRDVRRRIRRALEAVGAVPGHLRSLALSETVGLPGYRTVRDRLEREFDTNARVRGACEAHVGKLLGGGAAADDARFRAGLAYLHAELPFLLATPEVLGVPSSVCCYHDLLPVVEQLHDEGSCFHTGQAHAVVRPLTRDGRP